MNANLIGIVRALTISAWALFGVSCSMPKQTVPPSANLTLDAELAAIANDAASPLASLSVLAIRDGQVVYEKQFGSRWIDASDASRNQAADHATLYRIASISKLVTTLGVMRLVEAGTLKLDADVSDVLGFTLRNPHFPDTPITLRMLLSHTSSLRDDAGYYWEHALGVQMKDVFVPGGSRYGKGEMWATNAKPGAYFSYANLPWGVVGTLMERATGERFDRLMQRLIFTPMQLHGGFNPAAFSPQDLANTATLYRKRSVVADKEVWDPNGPWVAQVDDYSQTKPVARADASYVIGSNGTLFGPQGACRLSAADLGALMLMLLNNGLHGKDRILQPASIALMLAPAWQAGVDAGNDERRLFNAWGLGIQLFRDISEPGKGDRVAAQGGYAPAGHLGDAWGLTSAFLFDPVKKNGMIFLTGGPGFDPEKTAGAYSAFFRHEERILTALYSALLRF
jgi:CubicO group peptidase (beta-lactamase class C family)